MKTSNARVVASVIMMSAGVVLVAYGPDALRRIGHLVVVYGGYVLLGAAALLIFMRMVPRNARTMPVILALGGLALIGLQHRSEWYAHRWAVVGTLLILAGAGLSRHPPHPTRQRTGSKWPTPYRRVVCVWPRKVEFTGDYGTPTVLALTAIVGKLEVDLTGAAVPRLSHGMEIFVRCALGGRVKLRLPPDWAVAAGRLSSAYGITWDDTFKFDSGELFVDPYAEDWSKKLTMLAKDRREAIRDSTIRIAGVWVVVHVAGLGGSVRISR